MFIEGWYATVDNGSATITLVGEGFGTNPGTVRVIVQGGGVEYVTVLVWEDDQVIVDAPVNATIKKVEVDLPRGRGEKKVRLRTAAGEVRSTAAPTPSWAVTDLIATDTHLLVQGTDLANVDDAFFVDVDAPPKSLNSSVIEDNGDLIVTWPANYVKRLEKLILVGDAGTQYSEHDAPAGGWSPIGAALIENLVGGSIGSQAILQIYGIGFGNIAGTVEIREQGGVLTPANPIGAGWTDTLIEVAAEPSTTYDQVVVTDADSVVADEAASVPLTVTTPAVAVNLNDLFQTGEDPESFRILGSNLDGAFKYVLTLNNAQLEIANPAGGPAADAINTANGITTNTWTGTQIDFTTTTDLSGKIAQSLAALNDTGGNLGTLDFADFLVTGGGVSGTAAVVNATDGVYTEIVGSRGEGGWIRLQGTDMTSIALSGVLTVEDSGANDVQFSRYPGGQLGASVIVMGPLVPGERYTNPRVLDSNGNNVPVSLPVDEYFNGYVIPPEANEMTAIDSPAQDQLRLQGPDMQHVGFATVRFSSDGTAAGNLGTGSIWLPEQTSYDIGGEALATSQNAAQGVTVATATDEWLVTFAAGTLKDWRGAYVTEIDLRPTAGLGPSNRVFDAISGGDTAFQITP